MNSSLLLLKLFRGRIALSAVFQAALMGLVVTFFAWHDFLPFLAAALALIMLAVMHMHQTFARMLFPVSDHQAAWLPLAVAGVIWLAGLAGIGLGQGVMAVRDIRQMTYALDAWAKAAPLLPCALFMLVLGLRTMQVSPWVALPFSFYFIFFHCMLPKIGSLPHLAQGWRLFLAGSILFFLEAPMHWSAVRKLGLKPNKGAGLHWDLEAPTRQGIVILAADVVTYVCILLVFLPILNPLLFIPIRDHALEWFQHPALFMEKPPSLLYLFFGLLAVLASRKHYYEHRASGLGVGPALGVALLRLTLVLNPLAYASGVRKGTVIRCPDCAGSRFIWQEQCPHCHKRMRVAAAVLPTQPEKIRRGWDPAAAYYWITIPIWILFMFCNILRRK